MEYGRALEKEILPSGCKAIDNGHHEKETVHAIQHAAMPRDKIAGVLHSHLPFDQRFSQIAKGLKSISNFSGWPVNATLP